MSEITDEYQQSIDQHFQKKGAGVLFVAYDRDGFFTHSRSYLTIQPQNTMQISDEGFERFVKQNMNEVKIMAYIPNMIMALYYFPSMIDLPSLENQDKNEYLHHELMPYLQEKSISPVREVGLRDAVFGESQGISIHKMIENNGFIPGNIKLYMDFMTEQLELQTAYRNRAEHVLPIHCVETPAGNLYFSNSELGLQGLQQYRESLVGNYFSVHSIKGPVREYTTEHLGWDLNTQIDKCYVRENAQSPRKFHFDTSNLEQRPFDPRGWKLLYEASMQPTSGDFRELVNATDCRVSKSSEEISRLLNLKEHGFVHSVIEEMEPIHAREFRQIGQRINDCFNFPATKGNENLFDLVENVQKMADKILKEEYDVRGHRSFQRTLSDLTYDPQVGDIRLSRESRQVLIDGHNLYLPTISQSHPKLHYICADFKHETLRITENPFPGKIFTEKDGKILPYKQPVKHTERLKTRKPQGPKIG